MKALRMIPHNRLKNDNVEQILKAMHNPIPYCKRYNFAWIDPLIEEGRSIHAKDIIRKDIFKKFLEYKNPETDLFLIQNNISYEIDMDKENVKFRVVSDELESVKKSYEKYVDRIKFGEQIEDTKLVLGNNVDCVEMMCKDHFMFSLGIPASKNGTIEPLKYILDLKRYLKKDERFVYQVIIHPLNNDWWDDCVDAHNKMKEGKMPTKFDISPTTVVKFGAEMALKISVEVFKMFEELVYGSVSEINMTEDSVALFKRDRGLSKTTKDKVGEVGYEVSIRGICQSNDSVRRDFLLSQFSNCFSCLDGDNSLIMKKLKNKKFVRDRIQNREIFGRHLPSSRMILSVKEIAPLFMLPQVTLQREYKMDRLDYSEVRVSDEILDGYIRIGKIYGANKIAYWSRKKDILTLSKCIVGIKGSGKSQYTEKYVYDGYSGGDCVVYFDYIENNLNSHEVAKHIPKKDTITLDLSKGFTFDYPELDIATIPINEDYIRNVKAMASEYSNLISTFVDTINIGDAQSLTSNMQNILTASSSLCFVAGYTDIYSIYKTMTDHRFRTSLVEIVMSKNIYREDDFRYAMMKSLNEESNKGDVVGTNNKADRVLDRFNALLRDSRTEEMLTGIDRNNVNFVDLFEQNKVVFVLMPEDYFSDYTLKDIVMVYFLSRMRLSALKRAALVPDRDKRKVVHVILDEIHQLDNSLSLMTKFLNEDRKFRMCFYFTCQFIKQFRGLWDTIKGSGCHFMLLAGTEKENYSMLKEEIGSEFDIEELVNMPSFHSLNVVRGKDVPICSFMSKLPTKM